MRKVEAPLLYVCKGSDNSLADGNCYLLRFTLRVPTIMFTRIHEFEKHVISEMTNIIKKFGRGSSVAMEKKERFLQANNGIQVGHGLGETDKLQVKIQRLETQDEGRIETDIQRKRISQNFAVAGIARNQTHKTRGNGRSDAASRR